MENIDTVKELQQLLHHSIQWKGMDEVLIGLRGLVDSKQTSQLQT